MKNTENYVVELSTDEIHSLIECLAELRTHYVESLAKPLEKPVFVAASKLQHKIDHVLNPNANIPIGEYLNMGKGRQT